MLRILFKSKGVRYIKNPRYQISKEAKELLAYYKALDDNWSKNPECYWLLAENELERGLL